MKKPVSAIAASLKGKRKNPLRAEHERLNRERFLWRARCALLRLEVELTARKLRALATRMSRAAEVSDQQPKSVRVAVHAAVRP